VAGLPPRKCYNVSRSLDKALRPEGFCFCSYWCSERRIGAKLVPELFPYIGLRSTYFASSATGYEVREFPFPKVFIPSPKERLLIMIQHPKKRGEWVELQFLARATAHELTVSKPWGDTTPYDYIVEHKGTFHRVQVKSSMALIRNDYACSCHPPTRPTQAYTGDEIDFIAIFIIPMDVWYIIPVNVIERRKWGIAINPQRKRSKYFRYMEAWPLLREPRTEKPAHGRRRKAQGHAIPRTAERKQHTSYVM